MKILLLNILITMFTPTNELSGLWNTNKDNTKVEIYEKDGEYFGEIVSSDNEKAKKGTVVLRNFTYKNGKWEGKLYSLRFNKLIDAKMINDNNILKITAKNGMKSKTFEWEKL